VVSEARAEGRTANNGQGEKNNQLAEIHIIRPGLDWAIEFLPRWERISTRRLLRARSRM
jgi:hypothetical protein